VADTIHRLVMAEYRVEAEALARSCLAAAEAACDTAAERMVEARLLLAETLANQDSEKRMEAGELVEWAYARHQLTPLAPYLEAAIWRLRGILAHEQLDLQGAATSFERSADVIERHYGASHPARAAALVWLGRGRRGQGDWRKAEKILAEAEVILRHAPGAERDSLYDCLDYLASNASFGEDPSGALALYTEVLAEQERLMGSRAPRIAVTLYRLNMMYDHQGRTREAREALERALSIIRDRSDRPSYEKAVAHNALGILADTEGDLAAADSLYRLAYESLHGSDVEGTSPDWHARNNRAYVLLALGRVEEAYALAEESGRLCANYLASYANHAAGYAALMGTLCLALGRLSEADSLLASAYRHHLAMSDHRGSYSVALLRAQIDWVAGRVEEAFTQALDLNSATRDLLLHSSADLSAEDALSYETGFESGLDLALSAVASGQLEGQDTERTLDALVRSRGLVLSTVTTQHRALVTSLDSTLVALRAEMADLTAKLAQGTLRALTDDDRQALGELRAQRRAVARAMGDRSRYLAEGYDHDAVDLPAVRAALPDSAWLVCYTRYERRGEPPGFGKDMRANRPWYGAFVLSSRTAAVQFVDLGDATLVEGVVSRWYALASKSELSRQDRRRRDALGDSLRRIVWDPCVPAGLAAKRLFVVPAGSLALVPLGALPMSDGRALFESAPPISYLAAERHLVANEGTPGRRRNLLALGDPDFARAECPPPETIGLDSPEAQTELLAAAPGIGSRTYRSVGLGCEAMGASLAPLPFSGAEVEDVAALGRRAGMQATVLRGPAASEASFKQYAPGHSVVHVASHGFYLAPKCSAAESTKESPLLRSGLALSGARRGDESTVNGSASERAAESEDGVLTAEEVATIDLTGTECVVLSACETGIGDASASEGVVGLRWAFHAAGVRSLVTSLWRVDDAATRAWMREFYTALWESDADPAAACHLASLTMLRRLRASGQHPDPALWAGFVVSGR
jgi:CHAT domain-containing protein/tetratricopeptide (TPR) repeat protein